MQVSSMLPYIFFQRGTWFPRVRETCDVIPKIWDISLLCFPPALHPRIPIQLNIHIIIQEKCTKHKVTKHAWSLHKTSWSFNHEFIVWRTKTIFAFFIILIKEIHVIDLDNYQNGIQISCNINTQVVHAQTQPPNIDLPSLTYFI